MTLRLLDLAEVWLLEAKVKINEGLKAVNTAFDALTVLIGYGGNAYLEGTFTPALAFGGAAVGITYTSRSGVYTRVGRLVHIEIAVLLSSKGSSVGAAVISGLPLTVAQTTSVGGIQASALTAGVGDTALMAIFNGAATTVSLQDIGAGNAANLTDVDFTNTTLLRLDSVYRTSA